MKPTPLILHFILVLVLVGTAAPALAWGPEGHEIIAAIAESYLTPMAKEQLQAIIGSTKRIADPELSSWADHIRYMKEYKSVYPGNGNWHFVDFNVTERYDENFELRPDPNGNDVIGAIRRWTDELASNKIPLEHKLDAVRFVVHLVGDIHQPLHCAYRYGDMGGNMIPVHSFQGRNYSFDAETMMDFGQPSIHSVWDESMVYELLGSTRPRIMARKLQKEITDDEFRKWSNDNILQWAIDSYWRARKEVYRWPNGDPLPWKWALPGMDLTSENYIDARLPLVREQLKKGGVRLAYMINSALDPDFLAEKTAARQKSAEKAEEKAAEK